MLTKATIKKLYAAPIYVSLWNGNFNVASVKIHNNKKDYEIRYELSHPKLEVFSGKRDRCELIVWGNCTGLHERVPEELQELVQKLKEAATMSEDTADKVCKDMDDAMREYRKAFCLDD